MADILEQIAENNQKIYLDKKLDVSLSKVMDMACFREQTQRGWYQLYL